MFDEASRGIKGFNEERNAKINVGEGTAYGNLLALAIKEALGMYGTQVTEADSAILTQPRELKLHQPDERWASIQTDEGRVNSEAPLAAQYMVDTNSQVKCVVAAITLFHSGGNQVSVEQAYLMELFPKDDSALIRTLAEYRLRWSPKTEGPDIYIATKKGRLDYFHAWTQYKLLVHEVLHTAAHRQFMEYVEREARAAGASNLILEGTVDFFAAQVWASIVEKQKEQEETPEVVTVHAIQGKSKQISKELLAELQSWKDTPVYPDEVKVIKTAVKGLANGENRLKAAFFYGDVYHFFPHF